ncbi:hypothetical protein CR513_57485, partial [Mucuna pruriens]
MSTHMHPTSILTIDDLDKKVDQTLYRGMIDSLLYLTTSRLDIMFNWFKKSDEYVLKGYNDVDYAGDKIERKSTSRGCHFNGANLLEDYDIFESNIPLLSDNTAAINLSKNPILHSRT